MLGLTPGFVLRTALCSTHSIATSCLDYFVLSLAFCWKQRERKKHTSLVNSLSFPSVGEDRPTSIFVLILIWCFFTWSFDQVSECCSDFHKMGSLFSLCGRAGRNKTSEALKMSSQGMTH